MRTTIDFPEELLSEAKARAAREGRTQSEVVGDAVRSSFSSVATKQGPVSLPTFGGGGLRPDVDLDNSAALLELMESGG